MLRSYLPTGRQLWGTEMYKNKSFGGEKRETNTTNDESRSVTTLITANKEHRLHVVEHNMT